MCINSKECFGLHFDPKHYLIGTKNAKNDEKIKKSEKNISCTNIFQALLQPQNNPVGPKIAENDTLNTIK